jgi:GNAT superfamily N-acetyltransferase
MTTRVATAADVAPAIATVTSAFFDDPLWGPVFPDPQRRAEQASQLWRLLLTSAQRFPWTFVAEDARAVAVWIPPDGLELTAKEQGGFEAFLFGVGGRHVADRVLEIGEKFEAARPASEHFYLSLLATHPDFRGAGLGMALLRENLRAVDALGAPAYLESTNPRNEQRYRSVGFEPATEITMSWGPVVKTMWRPARQEA